MRNLPMMCLVGLFAVSAIALADEQAKAPNQSTGYQLAHRVAVKEKERAVPSPALWMSNRMVRNARNLAFFNEDDSSDTTPARKN